MSRAGRPRTILVTGTSSGFGRLVAVTLASRGWLVLATMRDPARREGLDRAAAAAGVPADRIVVDQLDVTSARSREKSVARALELFDGAPDILLHNAGYTTAGFFEDLSSEQQDMLLRTNLVGPMELTRLLLPAMRARGAGRIAVMSSNAVNVPHPMYSIYAASKWPSRAGARRCRSRSLPSASTSSCSSRGTTTPTSGPTSFRCCRATATTRPRPLARCRA